MCRTGIVGKVALGVEYCSQDASMQYVWGVCVEMSLACS